MERSRMSKKRKRRVGGGGSGRRKAGRTGRKRSLSAAEW